MKKKSLLLVVGLLVLSLLAGCGGGNATTDNEEDKTSGVPTVGVIQYAPHPSLDNCYEGFLEGLAESGFDKDAVQIDFQNAQGDAANSDMMAKNMVSNNVDMIVGIATPAAMSAYSASKGQDIPVVFTAVSDPLAAGIVQDMAKSGTNAVGSADVLPLEQQMKMIRAFLPEGKKIGILYTTSEPNSVSHLEKFKELAPTYDFEIVEVGVTNASEVASGAEALVAKEVDCINNFTDNNVVNNLSSVLQAAEKAKIPVFGSEIEQVKNGCMASESIDYLALGRETGRMAAKILKGEAKPQDMAVFEVEESTPVYNEEVMKKLGIALPEALKDAQAVK